MKKRIKKLVKKIAKKLKIDKLYIYQFLSKNFRLAHYFAKYYEKEPLKNNYIFYEAQCGSCFNYNVFALFKYLVNNEEFDNMFHVVALDNYNKQNIKLYKNLNNVILVKKDSKKYVKYIESCKYIISDNTNNKYFLKKEGQICVNSWHGSLFKTLGSDTKKVWETFNISKHILTWDYFISPNRFSSNIFFKAYYSDTLYKGKIIEEGYPANDLYFDTNKDEIKEKLNITSNKKIMVYAPTWRGTTSSPNGNVSIFFDFYEKLKNVFGNEYEILLKLHPMSFKYVDKKNSKKIVPKDIEVIDLLSITDLLITDYSGIMFDFLPRKKPIILFQFDKEEYLNLRCNDDNNEFYVNLDELPIPICKNINELLSSVKNIDKIFKNKIKDFEKMVSKYVVKHDSKICERIVDIIFKNKESKNVYSLKDTGKKKILLFPGELRGNGVTESFIALLDSIDYEKYDVITAIRKHNCFYDKQLRLNKNAKLFYLLNNYLYLNKHEFYTVRKYLLTGVKDEIDVLEKFAIRNMKRLFNDCEFDYAIDYNGYSPINALLVALGTKAKEKSIYLHSDLYKDMLTKNFQLNQVFSLYKFFGKLVCVCKKSMEANMDKTYKYILEKYNEECKDKFTYVINLINYQKVINESKLDTTTQVSEEEYITIKNQSNKEIYIKKPDSSNINFITIGRLYPEKNHANLIKAFHKFYKKNKNIRLYIVGEGVERPQLKNMIEDLNLESVVFLVGYTINPFELLNLCDCFILPSLYEGLGLVVLEAFTLGKAVISSDIEGPREFIKEYYGVLTEPTIEGLHSAMVKYAKNGMKIKEFDYKKFNDKAIKLFYENVLGEKNEKGK